MKIIRATLKGDDNAFYGILDESGQVTLLRGDPFACGIVKNDAATAVNVADLRLLPPAPASKIVAIGKNYHAHAMEMGEGEPEEPLIFLKPNTCLVAHEDEVVYPSISKKLDYEGELGVVIGKKCRNVAEEDALDVVFGYTCLNDVTARDIQKSVSQWTRGKSFDTFCPIGPWIETDIADPQQLEIETRLNGKVMQHSNTSLMTHSVKHLIAYITRVMTLLPGDIIATGTPEGVGPMSLGDICEVEIERIGVLRNTIVAE